MKVSVLAETVVDVLPMWDAYGYEMGPLSSENTTGADGLVEGAGRLCYKSFNRPNPATATNEGYLSNILSQQHFSVLEHASVTFLVRDVSRALLTELTRHRHLSFSVVSQRYVDYSKTEPVIPPAIKNTDFPEGLVYEVYEVAVATYEHLVQNLTERGFTRKQAREAARSVLPNAAPVDMVVTGNLRAWRDTLQKRHSVHADAELQKFAHKVLMHLKEIAPNSFSDIPDEPYGSGEK
ncbi:FAD-dependent thymidylate synthase [Streptomyces sp. NBC_01197]|uniref:FAD-dependent thymidylate synthase n=1 Tax=Streptomyces sp. NBC_01197 TaxID=2903768 RepID=UPI002E127543|nr:FAD-dependent thymidylate synthase [Streptomyces sp. NBC_01197]